MPSWVCTLAGLTLDTCATWLAMSFARASHGRIRRGIEKEKDWTVELGAPMSRAVIRCNGPSGIQRPTTTPSSPLLPFLPQHQPAKHQA